MNHDNTPNAVLREIHAARRAADQRVITVGMARMALALLAGTHRDPKAALEAAAEVARNRAASHYDERTQWGVIADLLETSAQDATVVTLARVGKVSEPCTW